MIQTDERILVTSPSIPEFEEYIEEIKDIWESKWLTNGGKKSRKLEVMLQEYLGADHTQLVVNGHMSLELTLQALQLQGEVITTPFTFASTTHAIVRSGLTPVFCDIDPVTYTIDANKIEELITERTCAILPVHVYGNICKIEKIQSIAKKHNLKVIYDAAHVFGASYQGKSIAAYGDVSCISMHATKVMNTIEGGVICYQDEEFGERIHHMKNFGIVDQENVAYVGTNGKMNEFCAAMGICNMRHIEENIYLRKECVKQYYGELQDIEGIQLNLIREDVKSNYAYFPVLFDEHIFKGGRDFVMEKLQEAGISARKYFYPLTSDMACYCGKFDSSRTPVAQDVSKRVLTLPLYAGLREDQVTKICNIVKMCR